MYTPYIFPTDFRSNVHPVSAHVKPLLVHIERAFNVWTILVAIPIIDQFIYPLLRQFAPNMLKRFGMSYVLLICSVGVLCLIEIVGHINDQQAANCMFAKEHKCTHHEDHSVMPLSAYLILVPVIMASVAEIFLKVTGQ